MPVDESLDLPGGMFRSTDVPRETTIQMGRTKVGLVNRDVRYSELDGLAIFEGDIVLGTVAEAADARGSAVTSTGRGLGIPGAQFRWPTPTIPYATIEELRPRVEGAIAHWQTHTPFKFVKRVKEEDFLSFKALNGCFSRVGRQGGEQVISLGLGCGLGAAIHEIGHSLGLWHEQSRSDRDAHVTILAQNIDPKQLHNFDKHILDGTDLGTYDFGSIMHYPRNAFSINGQDTIRTKDGEEIGQRNGLSAGDISAIRMLYPHFDWSGFV